MDIFLLVISIILILLIFAVYILNYIPSTRDLKKIATYLQKFDPTISTFCLGKNPHNNLYSNVKIQGGIPEIQENEYPIGMHGLYIVLKEHGDIIEEIDGFTIAGFDFVTFKCPPGFSGSTCQPIPVCGEDEEGNIKSITFTQFNVFNLNTKTFPNVIINETSSSNSHMNNDNLTHKRIRAKCLPNGEIEFQTCPVGTLLNEQLQCEPYDICQDSLPGRKHNYKPYGELNNELDDNSKFKICINENSDPKSSPKLNKHQYYICVNKDGDNVSCLRTCPDQKVFSRDSSGCITESICYGKGVTTLKNDDDDDDDAKSFIQCKHDQGIRITCANGIITNEPSGLISCKVPLCTPYKYEHSDIYTKYVYGETTCDKNDNPITTMCNLTQKTRIWEWQWGEKFQFQIPWPAEVMVGNTCQIPTDDIITNNKIRLRWSNAMPKEHLFDLKTEQFICENNEEYRWNYKAGVTEPIAEDTAFINPASPCQKKEDFLSPGFIPFPKTLYPPGTRAFIYLTVNTILDDYDGLSFWPRFNPKNDESIRFTVTICRYTDAELLVETFGSSKPPLGFVFPLKNDETNTESRNLILNGYADAEINPTRQHYFIATGEVETAKMYLPELIKPYSKNIALKTKIENTAQNITFSIAWHKITKAIEILPDLIFNSQSVTYREKIIDAGYIIMSIKNIKYNKSVFQIGRETDITVEFDCSDSRYKQFNFDTNQTKQNI